MPQTIPCLRCKEPYSRPRRNHSHYCKPCRIARNRIAQRARNQRRQQEMEELRARMPEEISVYLDDYGHVLELHSDGLPMSRDRLPAGSKTPAGPDEGRSTYFTDLAGELNTLCRQAASDPWWQENPHWAFDLHSN